MPNRREADPGLFEESRIQMAEMYVERCALRYALLQGR